MLKEMTTYFSDGAQGGGYKDIEDTEWVNEDGVRSSPRQQKRRFASRRCLVFSLLAILILFFTQHTGRYIERGELWTSSREIPNQVHFVRQVDKTATGDKLPLEFKFKHFMAIYSAHLWLKPERIFIWTDATKEDLASLKDSKNEYTRAIARLSTVKFGSREMPTVTSKGVPIREYAHKSDFVRAEVMYEYGGIYFDDDSWLLKDLSSLRKAGFDNVFARQQDTRLCQAMWMSKPKNPFMQAWVELQDREFTGGWTKAGNELISQLYLDFAKTDSSNHALVLEQDAFFPENWGADALTRMYGLHNGDADEAIPKAPLNLTKIEAEFGQGKPKDWRRDWGSSYSIHGWSTGIKNLNASHVFGEARQMTPQYVLSRESNIARALSPALQAALDSGVLRL